MFGLGFTEILLIAIAALLFIGPDKLPDTMKTIARTLGKIKRSFDEVKSTVENELRVDELRQEALAYRAEIEKAKKDLAAFKNVAQKEVNDIKEIANTNSIYKPTDINSDDDLFDDFFEEEKKLQEATTDKKNNSKANTTQPKEEKEVVEFKNIKLTKES